MAATTNTLVLCFPDVLRCPPSLQETRSYGQPPRALGSLPSPKERAHSALLQSQAWGLGLGCWG